jgi:hypothetical protein
MAYVYRHIRLDKNEPFYIGIGSDENYSRSRERYNRNGLWKIIATKSEIEVEILLDGLTYKEAQEKEKEFIALYGRKNNNTGILTNLTDGGEGTIGTVITEETRKKLSIAHKGNKSRTGHKLSEETRLKMSIARTGKKLGAISEEHRKKLSMAKKGTKQSIETIQKRNESRRLFYINKKNKNNGNANNRAD